MANLNEKQLLLLDTLIYVKADYADGRSLGDIANELLEPGGLDGVSIGAAMTQEQVETILRDVRDDPTLSQMVVDGYTNTEIRGACFVDPNTQEAVVVYRGTGPAYAAWDDNCQGGYLSDTDMQKEALEFAQKAADKYGNITVTGHSKGGNMAQYVTVVMGDQVDRCVSFDGQGFGDEFLEKYAAEIEANKDKIRSVNAYNDYVNILLTSIAGETVYLDNTMDGKGGHSPYGIYECQKNTMKNGEYITSKKQAWYIRKAKELLDDLMEKADNSEDEFQIYSVIGMILGLIFNEEDLDSWEKIKKKILEELKENYEDYIEQIRSGNSKNANVSVTVDTATLRSVGSSMSATAGSIESLRERTKKVQRQMASNVISGVAIGVPLGVVLRQLEKEYTKLEKLAAFLQNSADQYDTAEATVKGLVG